MKINPLDELALSKGYYFDLKAAEKVRKFFRRYLKHCKGQFAGRVFDLLDWQWYDFVMPVFGWKRPNGQRRFKHVFCEIAKKNGKSTLCAGLALYLLTADKEFGAEIYSIAGDKEQASIVYTEAMNMVSVSEALSERLNLTPSTKRMDFPDKKSFYRVLSSDHSTKHGYNVHGLIWDEYHVQKNDDLKVVLEYAGAGRLQPLQIIITTAGEDTLAPWYKEEIYAKQVLSGEIEDLHYYPLIYKCEEEDNWRDEKNWYKANPSLGKNLDIEEMRDAYQKCQHDKVMEIAFRQLRLCQLVNAATQWINLDDWDLCYDPALPLPEPGSDCFAAIDLAVTTDINALVLYFPETKQFIPYFWCPEEQVEMRRSTQKYKYDKFVRDGSLTLVPGRVMDYSFIERKIEEIQHTYNIKMIACDPYNATDLCSSLQRTCGKDIVFFFRQNFTNFSSASKMFEKGIIEHKFRHNADAMLKWMVKNTRVVKDGHENIRPDKGQSIEKIDGVVCCIMALAISLKYEEEHNFPYDSREIASV